MGASPIGLVVVTAADRAAATYAALENEPLRPPVAGTSPFRGGFAGSTVKRLPPQRELSAARLTEDKPLKLDYISVAFIPPWLLPRQEPRKFRLCGGEAVDGARLAAFRSPLSPLRPAHF